MRLGAGQDDVALLDGPWPVGIAPVAGAALGDHVLGVVRGDQTLGDGMAKHLAQQGAHHVGAPPADLLRGLVVDTCDQWRVDHMHRRVADRGEEIGAFAAIAARGLGQIDLVPCRTAISLG